MNPLRYKHRPQANAHGRKVFDDLHTEGADLVFMRVVLARRPGGEWERIGTATNDARAWAIALNDNRVCLDILVLPADATG